MLDWFFNLLGNILGVQGHMVRYFLTSGLKGYGATYGLYVVVAIAIIFVIKLFGWLNPGNLPKYGPGKMDKVKNSPLKGKNFIFLGSSVTKGFAAYGQSFADMIAARNDAHCVKEAVSGTTLADNGEKSYISRLKKLSKNTPCDVFVCQLSTNDATKKVPLGQPAAGKDMASFDTKTVCGAIEYIIAYAKDTWNCPVVFYTNPQYASPAYKAMVDALAKIAAKWDVQVIDLWNDREVNAKENKKGFHMNDQIHPTKKGYQLWTPVFEQALANVLAGKPVPARKGESPAKDQIQKAQGKKKIFSVLKVALIALLGFIIVVSACGFTVLNDTTGLLKPGNSSKYDPSTLTPYENSPLAGKTILCIGSSVTEGYASKNVSYCEYLAKLDSANVIKETAPGTTVANISELSYLPRLKQYDASTPVDAVVIQLSSNDSTLGSSLGDVGDSFDAADFDDTTFCGGMESLIAYCKDTWDCPVIIYANPLIRPSKLGTYNIDAYHKMAEQVKVIADKWNVGYLNMWDDEEMLAVSESDYKLYMSDPVHPTRAGYLLWWTPKFEEILYSYFE